MKRRKLWISIMAGIMAAIMFLSLLGSLLTTIASAATSSAQLKTEIANLKTEKAEIDAKIKGIKSQISGNKTEMKEIVEQKSLIDQEIFLLYEQTDNINAQITVYGQLIADKQAELDAAEAHLEELNEKNKERIRAMEEGGNLSYWSVLFKANSFTDLLDRITMIEEIAAADQRRLEQMSQAAKLVAVAKSELEEELAEQETVKAALEESQLELEAKREEADGLLAELIAKGDAYTLLLLEAEKETNALLNEIAQKEKEKTEAEKREYQEWLKKQQSTYKGGKAGESRVVDGITWLTPVNFTRVSSGYGSRVPPIAGASSFHGGVDLGASTGQPIIASRSGKVKYATYDSTSGYYVAIDHMDGYMTKYLHMTRFIVSPGDYVVAGQVIGYVGATGIATGPHLHFSVYYNGLTVNPANYINI